MQIDIISDTICPWCFIGKKRLETAMAQRPEIDFTVVWRPFQLHPEMPREGADRKTFMAQKFGNTDQARAMGDRIFSIGRDAGISFDFKRSERIPNTVDSHRVAHWAQTAGVQDAVIEGLFHAYFQDGRDVGDIAVLKDVAGAAGMEPEIVGKLLQGDADCDVVEELDAHARRMGVTGVPCFIFDQKYVIVGAQDVDVLLQAIDAAQAIAVEEAHKAEAGITAAE